MGWQFFKQQSEKFFVYDVLELSVCSQVLVVMTLWLLFLEVVYHNVCLAINTIQIDGHERTADS